jgi:hypothetical protein
LNGSQAEVIGSRNYDNSKRSLNSGENNRFWKVNLMLHLGTVLGFVRFNFFWQVQLFWESRHSFEGKPIIFVLSNLLGSTP